MGNEVLAPYTRSCVSTYTSWDSFLKQQRSAFSRTEDWMSILGILSNRTNQSVQRRFIRRARQAAHYDGACGSLDFPVRVVGRLGWVYPAFQLWTDGTSLLAPCCCILRVAVKGIPPHEGFPDVDRWATLPACSAGTICRAFGVKPSPRSHAYVDCRYPG